ncbi:MAG: AmmeMemoRadiSam system protein B [Gammaproteobacteria bacterium]|nr:AmmeMemoRadiSam system protein B [Gammaproteobacteria bacterium]
MALVRRPAVAGMFYPDDPRELRESVQALLAAAPALGPAPKALIAPHAGYVYSGPTAAVAYARLVPARETIRRVVLLGPSHRVPFAGIAACRADVFETPLGRIPVDTGALDQIADLPQVQALDAAHLREHSLEVQLPFLQVVLRDFALVPLVVGDASPDQVAQVLDRLWGGPETLIVVSSDLSHYHDYATAQRLDRETSRLIEGLSRAELHGEQACGCRPINGLLRAARSHGLGAALLDLRNSGDTAGPRDRVVGYGAYAFA